jgi:hypothetical protein
VFASLKAAYREHAERLKRGGVNTTGKEHFTSLFSLARERAFTPKNIKAGFAVNGLFPLNPDRVARVRTLSAVVDVLVQIHVLVADPTLGPALVEKDAA